MFILSLSEFQSLLTFELFSVMVHSGSAAGGHYYAHIKSFSDGQWYSFNDQHVSKVSLWLLSNQSYSIALNLTKHSYSLDQFQPLFLLFYWTDHSRGYQEDIWGVLREQRLLLQCLCKVGSVNHMIPPNGLGGTRTMVLCSLFSFASAPFITTNVG